MQWYQCPKAALKRNIRRKFHTSVHVHRKMVVLLSLSNIWQRCILFGLYLLHYFSTCSSQKYQVFAFMNMRNNAKDKKVVANWGCTNVCCNINGTLEILLCHFWNFYISSINMLSMEVWYYIYMIWFFSSILWKKIFKMDFQGSSKVLLSHKTLCSDSPWQ